MPPFSFLCPPFLFCFGLFEYFLYSIWTHLWFLSLCFLVVFFSWSYRDYNIHIYIFQSLLRINILPFQMKCLATLSVFRSFHSLSFALCIISSCIENPSDDGMVFSFNQVFLKEFKGNDSLLYLCKYLPFLLLFLYFFFKYTIPVPV